VIAPKESSHQRLTLGQPFYFSPLFEDIFSKNKGIARNGAALPVHISIDFFHKWITLHIGIANQS